MADDEREARILQGVRAIPEGYVRTYGDLDPGAPRLVGRVLARGGGGVPWHRVVRADGGLAQGARQEDLLRAEDVPFRPSGRVDLTAARLPLPAGEHLDVPDDAELGWPAPRRPADRPRSAGRVQTPSTDA